jgi:hypothetical protein
MEYFTTEEPRPQLPDVFVPCLCPSFQALADFFSPCSLSTVKGEWHEYESKRARKKERG